MIRKDNGYHMQENDQNQITYLTFPVFEKIEWITHLFTTRKGGVSRGIYESMNLSFQRGDDPLCVHENFRRIAAVLQTTPERIVCARQTHTTNIRLVTEADCGKGVVKEADYDEIDGLITNEPGIMLCTSFADCVPLYFIDPAHHAIGLAHSGWRGTVNRMGACMIQAMYEQFGSKPDQLLAAIGPSICVDCYEVGKEVAEEFRRAFPDTAVLQTGKAPGKYQLDLWKANQQILLEAGIAKEHLYLTDICTCCNADLLFSHRASNGKRGNLCAFLGIKNEV